MIREPLAGRGAQGLDEVQVIMRGHCRTVSQVGRQQWQLGFDIDASSVPTQQGIDREAVTIMPTSA